MPALTIALSQKCRQLTGHAKNSSLRGLFRIEMTCLGPHKTCNSWAANANRLSASSGEARGSIDTSKSASMKRCCISQDQSCLLVYTKNDRLVACLANRPCPVSLPRLACSPSGLPLATCQSTSSNSIPDRTTSFHRSRSARGSALTSMGWPLVSLFPFATRPIQEREILAESHR